MCSSDLGLVNLKNFENAARIDIHDRIGRKIIEQNTPCNQIDLTYLSSGIYFVRIITLDNLQYIEKIVIK